jgi:hypothetical protein
MKKIISALSVAVAFAVASQASAAIIVNVDQVSTVGPNSTAIVRLTTNTPGGVVSALQGTLGGNVAFQGVMNQVLVGGAIPTPTQDFNAAIDEATDTQFLALNAELLAVTPPFETANTAGGVFTYQVAKRAADLPIWQVVAPTGTPITYGFTAAEAVGANSFEFQLSGNFIVGIPEPATAGLGSFALLGLAAFRRRFFA